MYLAVIFWLFLLSAGLIICIRGSWPERGFLLMLIAASILTILADRPHGINNAGLPILLIDAGVLAISLGYVVLHDRYWPMWFAGFQTISVATEVAQMLFPHAVPGVYESAARLWSLPAIMLFAIGVALDRHASDRNGGFVRPAHS